MFRAAGKRKGVQETRQVAEDSGIDQFMAYKFVTGQCIFQSVTFKLSVVMREKYEGALGKKFHILIRLKKWCGTVKERKLEFLFGHCIQLRSRRQKQESKYVKQKNRYPYNQNEDGV